MLTEDSITATYPVIPLKDLVIFPHVINTIFVGRKQSLNALDNIQRTNKRVFMVAQKDAAINDPQPEHLYSVGTVAEVIQALIMPKGNLKILTEGHFRGEIKEFTRTEDYLEARVTEWNNYFAATKQLAEMRQQVLAQIEYFIKISNKFSPETQRRIRKIEDPNHFIDFVGGHLTVGVPERQRLLEAIDPVERMELLSKLVDIEIDFVKLDKKLKSSVKKQMEDSQKQYYLNEQMKAIQKEMSQTDGFSAENKELRDKIENSGMPEEAKTKALNELKKLEMMSPQFAEASVLRNYLDWLISVPWKKKSEENNNINQAEEILDEDHYGLKEVKSRILEYLAVRQLVEKSKAPILCFLGPPGVGKTSLGKSIARATNRKFVRISLGGVRDEAEIRGHRRTYIGSMPGRIIQSMRRAGTINPVFLLDEIDKLGADYRGDPSAALLEALDPEQNQNFSDHYLEVEYDLSNVMFITTANLAQTIPAPLMDRMEVIRIPGYTDEEKSEIAKSFLIPKQLENNGLKNKKVSFQDEALNRLIRSYTREAGVRNLEREISSICRKVAKEIVSKKHKSKLSIDSKKVLDYLGPERFKHWAAEKSDQIGVASGLAWTEMGGLIMSVEATILNGNGKLTLTGKLGDIMQESAQAALSYVRSRTKRFNLDKDFYKHCDIHIHIPEGAIPKDGPSAGITLATAIISVLTQQPVRCDVAMTGEITLRGRVLKIGGLKEKVLAAHRAGIHTIIIPEENVSELAEIPDNIKPDLDFKQVSSMDEVLDIVFREEGLFPEPPDAKRGYDSHAPTVSSQIA